MWRIFAAVKTEKAILTFPANGRTVNELKNDIRFAFMNLSRLNVTDGGEIFYISFTEGKYKKSDIQKFLSTLK